LAAQHAMMADAKLADAGCGISADDLRPSLFCC
jgi:hypothetical protein